MTQRQYWFCIEPVDTLFFRGAEGMEAGEHHEVDTMFPPLPETICGALRTAVMAQNQVVPAEFLDQPKRYTHLPLLGTPERSGLTVTGPLFAVDGKMLFPAPAHWFTDKNVLKEAKDGATIQVETARPLDSGGIGLCGGASKPFWVHRPIGRDLVPLSGYWVTADAIEAVGEEKFSLSLCRDLEEFIPDNPILVEPGILFRREPRTGIALTSGRTAQKGHLYSSVHIRMAEGVSLVFAIDRNPVGCLASAGILQLGGEQRVCRYRMVQGTSLPRSGSSGLRLALCPVPTELIPADVPRAAGKISRVGGWDMKNRFHKPMQGYYPVGSVFAADIDDQRLIAI